MRSGPLWSRSSGGLGMAMLLTMATTPAVPAPASAAGEKYDIVAVGTTVAGKVGDVVTVTVGITNKGPDRYLRYGVGQMAVTWQFVVPPGTETVPPPSNVMGTIVGSGGAMAPNRCGAVRGDRVFGVDTYDCWSANPLLVGDSSRGTFYLRINEVIPNAEGSIKRLVSRDSVPDLDPDNDEAPVIVNEDSSLAGMVGLRGGSAMSWAMVATVAVLVGGLFLRARRRRVPRTDQWADRWGDPFDTAH